MLRICFRFRRADMAGLADGRRRDEWYRTDIVTRVYELLFTARSRPSRPRGRLSDVTVKVKRKLQ
jgi:hypothetical protein